MNPDAPSMVMGHCMICGRDDVLVVEVELPNGRLRLECVRRLKCVNTLLAAQAADRRVIPRQRHAWLP